MGYWLPILHSFSSNYTVYCIHCGFDFHHRKYSNFQMDFRSAFLAFVCPSNYNECSYPDQIFGFLYKLCIRFFFWISEAFSAWNGRKVHGIGLEEELYLRQQQPKQLFAFWMMMSRGYTSSCFLCVSLPAQSILASQAAADLKGNILWTSRPSQASLWNSSAKSSCTNVATLMGKNSKSYEGYQAYANLLWPSIQLQLQNWPVMVVL